MLLKYITCRVTSLFQIKRDQLKLAAALKILAVVLFFTGQNLTLLFLSLHEQQAAKIVRLHTTCYLEPTRIFKYRFWTAITYVWVFILSQQFCLTFLRLARALNNSANQTIHIKFLKPGFPTVWFTSSHTPMHN